MKQPPRVLLVGLLPGIGGLQLPRHLARAGLEPAFLGSGECMASHSGHIREKLPWSMDAGHLGLDPLLAAVDRLQPQRLVGIDELAVQVLQQVGTGHAADGSVRFPDRIVALVRRSLGDPKGYSLFTTRRHAFETARAAAIPVPAQANVESLDSCLAFAAGHGYPVVVKAESSMGGTGSFILGNEAELRDLFARGRCTPGRTRWIVQAFVPGRLGMHAVVAERGRVLAKVSAVQVVRRSANPTAPSSVVRLCRHQAMADAGAAFVAATGASGFHAWDFQLDDGGNASMIEHNPRPITISHLGGLLGDDLCDAFAAACGAAPGHRAADGPAELVVALFPYEWRRDPQSPYLQQHFHDIPEDDPLLLAAVLRDNLSFV